MGNCLWYDLGLPRHDRTLETGQTSLLPKKGRQAAWKPPRWRQDSPNGAYCRSKGLDWSIRTCVGEDEGEGEGYTIGLKGRLVVAEVSSQNRKGDTTSWCLHSYMGFISIHILVKLHRSYPFSA